MSGLVPALQAVDFRGAEGGRGPRTWGQGHIWAAALDNRGDPDRYVLRRVWPVPQDRTVADVVAVLRTLVERHEALRTRIDVDESGMHQIVLRTGRLACQMTDSTTDWSRTAALRAAGDLSVGDPEPTEEPPVRFQVLTRAGRPQWIAAAVSHFLVDAESCAVLAAEAGALLDRTGAPPSVTYQPRQRAHYERSADGRTQNERAVRHWRTTLEQHPEWLFPPRTCEAQPWQGERFAVVQAHAPGLGRQVEEAADRSRVSAPSLCLAAWCKAFATRSATTAYALGVTFSNRVLPWSRGYVGTLAQQGVIGVRDVDVPLDRLARRTWHALLMGHRFSQYDQDDVFATIAQVCGRDQDWYGPVSNFVNFQYRPAPVRGTPSAARTMGGELVFTDLPAQKNSAVRFGLHINSDRSDLVVRVSVDQACVTVDTMRDVIEVAVAELRSLHG